MMDVEDILKPHGALALFDHASTLAGFDEIVDAWLAGRGQDLMGQLFLLLVEEGHGHANAELAVAVYCKQVLLEANSRLQLRARIARDRTHAATAARAKLEEELDALRKRRKDMGDAQA